MALRFGKKFSRLAAIMGVLVLAGVLATAVLFARDRVLLRSVLANVDAPPPASAKACANPCRSGRMLLL